MTFKKLASSTFLVLLHFARPATSYAQNFNGSDNFNSPAESSNWGTDITYGSGALTQTNGYLQFTSAGTGTNGDYAARPWVANYGSDTANWSVQIDTTVLQSTADTQFVSFGLEIWDAADTNLYVGDIDGGASGGYSAYVGSGEDNLLDTASAAGLSHGAVMLSFNAATQVITTYYDSTSPSVGYNWVEIGSFGIAGSGGTTGNVNWDLGPAGTFQVAAVGYSDDVAATAGNVYGDNFVAVPEPNTSALAVAGMAMLFCLLRRRRGDRIISQTLRENLCR